MKEFTIEDLVRILIASAGVSEEHDLTGDILDIPFDELGYDSLALLQSATKIQEEFGVSVPDDAVAEFTTPRATLTYVNKLLAEG